MHFRCVQRPDFRADAPRHFDVFRSRNDHNATTSVSLHFHVPYQSADIWIEGAFAAAQLDTQVWLFTSAPTPRVTPEVCTPAGRIASSHQFITTKRQRSESRCWYFSMCRSRAGNLSPPTPRWGHLLSVFIFRNSQQKRCCLVSGGRLCRAGVCNAPAAGIASV